MKPSFMRILSLMLAACLALALAPAAPAEDAEDIATEPVDAAVSPDEAAELGGDESAPPEALYEAGALAVNAVTFPDPVFRQYVLDNFDTDGDGALSLAETDAVRQINVEEMGISDLTGVEWFGNLTQLNCTRNALTALNVRSNAALKRLYCGYNQLTALDVSGLSALANLSCGKNQLTVLELGGCAALEDLDCSDNKLSVLDLSGSPALSILFCSYNQLTSLTLGNQPALSNFWCQSNQLTALDVSRCPKLEILGCGVNKLSELNLSGNANLKFLDCEANRITALDITACPKITQYVNSAHYAFYGTTVQYTDDYNEEVLGCDSTVSITGGDPVPARLAKYTIAVNKNTAYTATAGNTYQIDPAGKGYKSSKKSVAAVDQNGVITAKSAGKAKITFKVGKKKRTLTLTVVDPSIPTAVYLDKTGTVALKKGEQLKLTATLPEGTTSDIRWASSNRKVAAVSQDGTVTCRKPGKATITATTVRGGKKAKVKFKVTK